MTYAEVQAEFDAGDFLRTHILRPTWHFVAAEDMRWILAVTAATGSAAQRHDVSPSRDSTRHALDRALS